jgi:hypothetical protein
MALIKCDDCGHDVSDRAPACPHCGAPIAADPSQSVAPGCTVPIEVSVDGENFVGTKALLIKLAARAILSLNYKVDSADEASGLISFTTGMTMGSWSGVSGSLYLDEIGPNKFTVSGTAKQNVRGGQILALDIGGEAKGKVRNVIEEMRRLAQGDVKSHLHRLASQQTVQSKVTQFLDG